MGTIVRVARLVDGTGAPPWVNAEIVIAGGEIVARGPWGSHDTADHQVLDYSKCTAVPGFIDLHTHFCYPLEAEFQKGSQHPNRVEMAWLGLRSARAWLEQGVTTARVLGTHFDLDFGLRDLLNEQPALGPRLLAAGRMMTMTGGKRTPWDYLKDEVTGANEARRWARAHLQEGADVIKLYCTTLLEEDVADYLKRKLALPDDAPDPGRWASLTVDEIRSTVEEAHKVGGTVAAHVSPAFGIKLALHGGVDTIDHGTEMDDACIDLFLEIGATLVPTLSVSLADINDPSERGKIFAEFSKRRWEHNKTMVRRALEAGVRIGTGTDNVVPGMFYATEVELLVEVGASPLQAICCATQRGAACLGPKGAKLGTLEPGKWADVVLLNADPLANIRNIRQVVAVYKAGEVVAQPTPAREAAHA
jgi:imidazolonepropionase-like amidohydrolase